MHTHLGSSRRWWFWTGTAALWACGDAFPTSSDATPADTGAPDAAQSADAALPDVPAADLTGSDASAIADAAALDTDLADSAPDLAPGDGPGVDASAVDASPADTAPPKPVYTFVAAACGATPTEGAVLAKPPKPYSGGTCPKLVADGKTPNTFKSGPGTRSFLLLAPADLKPGEKVPVLFGWHWLKAKAKSFIDQGELPAAVAAQRFVAVMPESKGDIQFEVPLLKDPIAFPWPFLSTSPAARFEEEYTYFDDMLACVAEQFPIDKECVSVVGVSAGALFAAHLAAARSEQVASLLSLSGGVKSAQPFVNTFLAAWKPPVRKVPMLVLWGGPNDTCALLNFQAASQSLESSLDKGGHVTVECIHNCAHGVPPVDAPPGQSKFAALWQFAWSHPFWLPAGATPWAKGLPAAAPEWCALGTGMAKMRSGACGPAACPL